MIAQQLFLVEHLMSYGLLDKLMVGWGNIVWWRLYSVAPCAPGSSINAFDVGG